MKKHIITMKRHAIAQGAHYHVPVIINGHRCRMMVDTGASCTVFDREEILQMIRREHVGEGTISSIVTGSGEAISQNITIESLKLGKAELKNRVVVAIDLQGVNQEYKNNGVPMIVGVIGVDVLEELAAVIDCSKPCLKISVN